MVQKPVSVNWGPAHSGQAANVQYSLVDVNGTVRIAATNSGVTELQSGSGLYGAILSLDLTWPYCRLIWTCTGTNLSAAEVINPAVVLDVIAVPNPDAIVATFDPSLPTVRDRVRLRVGDVSSDPQWFLADASIDALLAAYPGQEEEVCAQCCETIGAICNQKAAQVQQRNMKRVYNDRAKSAFELADRIRNLAAPPPGAPAYHGAIAGQMRARGLDEYLRGVDCIHEDHRYGG